MPGPLRILLALAILYLSWLAMMAVHESGHVLAALLTGGTVRHVTIPLADFSRTDVDPNPSPRLEIWAGPLWGSMLPLLAWLLFFRKLPHVFRGATGFFTGLCLIANGVYLGIGWTMTAGDAADLEKLGTPTWLLILFGLPTTMLGLYIWHTLGQLKELFKGAPRS